MAHYYPCLLVLNGNRRGIGVCLLHLAFQSGPGSCTCCRLQHVGHVFSFASSRSSANMLSTFRDAFDFLLTCTPDEAHAVSLPASTDAPPSIDNPAAREPCHYASDNVLSRPPRPVALTDGAWSCPVCDFSGSAKHAAGHMHTTSRCSSTVLLVVPTLHALLMHGHAPSLLLYSDSACWQLPQVSRNSCVKELQCVLSVLVRQTASLFLFRVVFPIGLPMSCISYSRLVNSGGIHVSTSRQQPQALLVYPGMSCTT